MQKRFLIFLFFFICFLGFSQNYPVQTTIQLTPPYTSYLPDYTDGVNSKLQVALHITDVNEPVLQVKLKVTLEGPGGKIVTNPNFVQSPITLNFGEVLVLSGDELAPYLAFQNLVFPSETFKQNYQQTKVLPEGLWKLCVDVLDATNPNSELLSSNNCALMFVARLQPPMLNLPVCETTLPRSQTIFFSWTDMALGSYAIGHEPLYDFSLYSVPISAYENPTQVLNTNPIYTETTTIPSLNLDTNLILLPAGQKYLWQVKARFSDGSGAYLNNGMSAPCVFTFGDLAQEIIDDLTINLTAEGTGPTVGQASWTLTSASGGNSQFDSYVLAYRKAGNEYYAWYEEPVTSLNYLIQQLEDSTLYEVKVKGIIGTRESEWTDVVTFITQPYPNYACGDGNIRPLPPTFQPLLPMNAYEGIRVAQGQFFMDVTSINPTGTGEGHYRGTGRIHIDFLFVNVRVSFSDLLIDDQYNAREGEIMVITKGLKDWLHDQYGGLVDPTWVNGVIDSVTVIDSTAFVYVGGVAVPAEGYDFVPVDYPIIFQDDDGNQFTTYSNGNVTQGTFLDVENEYLEAGPVYFAQASNETFGFDAKEHIQWHENYEIIHNSDSSNYFVANKSTGSGVQDYVDVTFSEEVTPSLSLLVNGTTIQATSVDGSGNSKVAHFFLPAFDNEGKYEVYALNTTGQKIGKLIVHVYEEITKKVYVVPLVSFAANIPVLKETLDQTIGEANIKLDVQIAPIFSNEEFNNQTEFNLPNATLMTKYSLQMRNLKNAYLEANPDVENDAILLFVVNNLYDSTEAKSIGGYMVKGRSLGFINVANIGNYQTIAHELGHGIGALAHSWNSNGPTQGATNNLMDYSNGTNLLKSQWEELRNPSGNSIWDEEEDNATHVAISAVELEPFKDNDNFYFITPDEQYVALSSNIKSADFSLLERFVAGDTRNETDYVAPLGTLIRFVDSENKTVIFKAGKGYYYEGTDNKYIIDIKQISKDEIDSKGAIVSYVRFSGKDLFPIIFKAKLFPNSDHIIPFDGGQIEGPFQMLIYPPMQFGKCPNTTIKELPNVKISYPHSNIDIAFHFTNGLPENYNSLQNSVISFNELTIKDFYGSDRTDFNVYEVMQFLKFKSLKYTEASSVADCIEKEGQLLKIKFKHMFDQISSTTVPDEEANALNQKFRFNPGFDQFKAPTRTLNLMEIKEKYETIGSHSIEDAIQKSLTIEFDQVAFDEKFNWYQGHKIAENFYNLLDYLHSLPSCKLTAIPWGQRIEIIRSYVNYDDVWNFSPADDPISTPPNASTIRKPIFYNLFHYIPEADEVNLINELYTSNSVTDLYVSLFGNMDNTGYDADDYLQGSKILGKVSNLVVKNQKYNLNSDNNLKIDILDESINDLRTDLRLPNGMIERTQIQIILGESSGDEFKIGSPSTSSANYYLPKFRFINNNEGSPIILGSDKKFYIKQRYTAEVLEYSKSGDYISRSEVFKVDKISNPYTLSPNDVVEIVIAENLPKLGLSKGQSIVMTVADAFLLQKNIEEAHQAEHVSIFIDVATIIVSIITVPVTGGSSLALMGAVVGTTSSAIDIYYQSTLDEISPEEYNKSAFYSKWENIKLVCDFADLGLSAGAFLKPGLLFNGKTLLSRSELFKFGVFKHHMKYLSEFADNIGVSNIVKTAKTNVYNFVKLGTQLPVPAFINKGLYAGTMAYKKIKTIGQQSVFYVMLSSSAATASPLTLCKTLDNVEHLAVLRTSNALEATESISPHLAHNIDELNEMVSSGQALKVDYLPIKFIDAGENAYTTLSASKLDLITSHASTIQGILYVFKLDNIIYNYVIQQNAQQQQTIVDAFATTTNGVQYKRPMNNCIECPNYSQTICWKFKYLKDNYENPITKEKYDYFTGLLCGTVQAGSINNVLTNITALVYDRKNDLKSDLTVSGTETSMNLLGNNKSSITAELLDAWLLMNTAKTAENGTRYKYVKDYQSLVALKELMAKSVALSKLGGKTGLEDVLKKNATAPCEVCDNNNNVYIKMDDYINYVSNFAQNFTSSTMVGYEKVLGSQGIKSNGLYQVNATAFVLRVLAENPSYVSSITGFEEKVESINDENETYKAFADITQNGNKIIECKSWLLNGISFQKFLEGTSGSVQQFITYLSSPNVNSMNDIEYWFDKMKLGGSTDATPIKEKFKAMMLQNGALTSKGDQIWAIISTRATILTELDVQTKSEFILHISNTSNKFYDFIYVK